MRAEGVDQGYIGRVPASGNNDPADPWNIIAWIEAMPFSTDKHFDPSAEIHGINHRHTDISQMTVHIACGNIQATAEGNRQMREVPAHPNALIEGFQRRAGRACLHIVELNMTMDKVAYCLHARPAGLDLAE